MARVLVLGGTGFVGPVVVRRLLEQGDDVVVFHRGLREPVEATGAEHVHDDFSRLPQHVGRLAESGLDVVLDVSPGIDKAGHGVLHFAQVARRGVVLTSMDVYRAMSVLWGAEGRLQPMPVTEDAELRSRPSPDLTPDLAFDNIEVERAVTEPGATFPVTILRCPIIYGPRDPQRRLQPYVRRMADSRPAIVLDSRLARLRLSRGHVENVAIAVVTAVGDERAAGRVFNVGEAHALTEAEWVRAIAAVYGWPGEIVTADAARLPAALHVPVPPQDIVGDTSRIRGELGYAESLDPSEGLRRAIEWELEQERHEPAPDYTSEDLALRNLDA